MQEMVAQGIKTVIEIGPGKVLTGLMRRITKEIKTFNFQDPQGLDEISQQKLEDCN